MRPRYVDNDEELTILLKEAKELEERLVKSQPEYSSQKEGSMQGNARFEIQPSGVPNAFYNTNNVVPEVEDVKNKGAISENSKVLDENPYYPTAFSTDRVIDGGAGPIMKSLGGSAERLAAQDFQKSVDQLTRRLN
jgi:hypothetical protein|tara:strand:+ start:4080 stop:4487 length:408 start_codon:yes stop_codon:yes gene_type:complete